MSSKHRSRSIQPQKKLAQVKNQLYGHSQSPSTRSVTPTLTHLSGTYSFVAKDTPISAARHFIKSLDTDYLKQDLKKIALLSTLVIGFQLGLLFLVNRLSF